MSFPNDLLADLETATRIFRTNVPKSSSPFNLYPQNLFPSPVFLGKREVIELEDIHPFSSDIEKEFFNNTSKLVKPKTDVPLDLETVHSSQKLDDGLKITEFDHHRGYRCKLRPTKVNLKTRNEIDKKRKTESIKETFLSEPEESENVKTTVPASNDIAADLKQPQKELRQENLNTTSYDKVIEQHKSSSVFKQTIRKRKISMHNTDRGQLKNRVSKVAAFWKGENAFLPSIFRLLRLEKFPHKVLIEFQDFSLKGVNHVNESCEEQDAEAIMAEEMDGLSAEGFVGGFDFFADD